MADEKNKILPLATEEIPQEEDLKTVTVDGVEVTIDLAVFDDIEFLETIADIDGGDGAKLVALLKNTFGKEDYARIKKELKGDKKRLKISDLVAWFGKVMQALGQKKS